MKKSRLVATLFALASIAMVSCNKGDDKAMPEHKSSMISFENVVKPKDFVQSGSFKGVGGPGVNMPVVLPGSSISFKFNAGKGQALMFATMYGKSKDWFFAPENPGLNLYDDKGMPMTGDVSNQIKLWDNGSKNNETGAAENNNVMQVPGVDASKLMRLMLDYNATTSEFTLTITNTSRGTSHETPFSPGVWAVSNVLGGKLLNDMPFYKAGAKSNPEITAIAEMGNNMPLVKKIADNTGIITGISPAIVVIYTGNVNPLFVVGKKDAGMGLSSLAQKDDATALKSALEKMPQVKKVYIAGNAPIGPGQKAHVMYDFAEGDHIAYATMFGYSNDWFYANNSMIAAGLKGDVTAMTALFDDGTAVDQYPGAGNAQALFGGKPIKEDKNIIEVGKMFPVLATDKVLRVILK
ncbi:spondin domain-containing protein [Porphyromonas pogonae]|uniref:spondin domain-containing protein n=1 Tax=Porphyromonas pogonae TaxID=867595 RepID=UPI002E777511|nr:spondin domain-containing protein [Porphyromonas pogonae]